MRGIVEVVGIRVFKEGVTWKVRGDRTVKEGWGRIEIMGTIREG